MVHAPKKAAIILTVTSMMVHGFVVPFSKTEMLQSISSTSSAREESIPETATKFQIPDMNVYSSGYQTVFNEQPAHAGTPTFGRVPTDLAGTYFRAGPAMFSAGSIMPPKTSIIQPKQGPPVPDGTRMERMVNHPFEADGGVLAVTFDPTTNTCISRFRYVRTNAFTKERKAGQRLYSGMDSTRQMQQIGHGNDLIQPLFRHHLQPGLNKFRKNTSNTRVILWANKLISLWDGGLPYKLDRLALSTEGRSQLGGVLKEEQPMGAKAIYDAKRQRMVMYASQPDPRSSKLTIYEFNAKFALTNEVTTDLEGYAHLSDFGMTDNYYVFVQPPVAVNAMKYIFTKEPGKILELQQGPSTLHLIPRDESGKTQLKMSIPFDGISDAGLQIINSYEQSDGTLIIDAIRLKEDDTMKGPFPSWPWASTLTSFQQTTCQRSLVRYTVKGNVVTRKTLMDSHQCYFGGINPLVSTQEHKYIYMTIGSMGPTVAPPQGIARFDTATQEMKTWMPQANEFCGEPIYAKRTTNNSDNEDDGYILSVLFHGTSSDLVILRANDIAAGPMTRIPLGIAVPHGLNGCYSDEGGFTFDEIDRRAKLADKMESRGNMWNEVKSDFSGLGLRLDDFEEYFGDMM